MSASRLPHVVIVGGGFAGLYAAQAMRKMPVRVTLVDRRNHHTFQPLLYQVATAALNASEVAWPIRRILRHQENVTVLLGEVVGIDRHAKEVVLSDRRLAYDKVIVATGATHFYFGHDEWAANAPGLKTVEDALDIRRRILFAFEAAEREEDPERQRAWLTFVVVGGGPTGVELAGAISEIARKTLANDFRRIDPQRAVVILLEGGPRVLPSYSPGLSQSAKEQLERIGVSVRTGAMAKGVDPLGVSLDGERIEARTVLWAAGVAASPLAKSVDAPLDKAGRVRVTPALTVPGDPDVYVVGDLASLEQDGKLVPGVAQAAIQEGKHAARNIERSLRGAAPLPFRYVDKGSMATIGKGAAIAEIGSMKLDGFMAWLAWLAVHVLFLIGFRNRLVVLSEWAWFYLTHERGARLITGELPPDAGRVLGAKEESAVASRPMPGWTGTEGPKRKKAPQPKVDAA